MPTRISCVAERVPAYFRLAGIVPAALIKAGMKSVAKKKPFGTLCWERGADPGRTAAFFGSQEERGSIPGWDAFDLSPLPEKPVLLDHGYDETKPESALGLGGMRRAAEFRGGRCISETMETGDLHTPLEWECARGHRFRATPRRFFSAATGVPDAFRRPSSRPGTEAPRMRENAAAPTREPFPEAGTTTKRRASTPSLPRRGTPPTAPTSATRSPPFPFLTNFLTNPSGFGTSRIPHSSGIPGIFR